MKRLVFILLLVIGVNAANAQDLGAQQDAIAERQKVLKAADQLDLLTEQNTKIIQHNTQLTQELSGLKERVAKLEAANGELQSQLAQQQKD